MKAAAPSRVIVIGAGLGGLAAAIRLQARGYSTLLLERGPQAGGRAAVLRDQGFTFDLGPTVITAPFMLEDLFALAGRRMEDALTLTPCSPFYRILLHDGSVFDYGGSEERVIEEIRRFSPDDARRYPAYARRAREFCDRAFVEMADRPFFRFRDMLRVAPALMRLRADRSVYSLVARHIKHPLLRQVFSFNPLLVGGNPFAVSSVYSMIHHLEREWGMHYVQGGTNRLVSALAGLYTSLGGELVLNTPVERIRVVGGRAAGVEAGGTFHRADAVVSNADTANTYLKLIDPAHRRKWTDRRVRRMRTSMGLFLLAFGTRRTYPDLAHHTILLSREYRALIGEIFHTRRLPADPSIYLHAPSRSDATVAPAGHDAFYALAPVPHLGGRIDWEKEKDRFAGRVLEIVSKACPGVADEMVVKHVFTPEDFGRRFDSHLGAGFQFEPTLLQSAWFRPHNKSEDVEGLYLVGAGTHPGAGIPGVLASAKLVAGLFPEPGTRG